MERRSRNIIIIIFIIITVISNTISSSSIIMIITIIIIIIIIIIITIIIIIVIIIIINISNRWSFLTVRQETVLPTGCDRWNGNNVNVCSGLVQQQSVLNLIGESFQIVCEVAGIFDRYFSQMNDFL